MGAGALVEFASVIDAVTCALAIQDGMTGRNEGVSEDRRIVLRIGVHLGDVMVEGSDLYGDGVNVAARLEGLAAPGGVCITQQTLGQIETKLALAYQDLGEQRAKNIARPIHVWHLHPDASPSVANRLSPSEPLPLPHKPSIAVLPFNNMSSDPEQAYFADGISEDIITDLSKIASLFVIARNSSFVYKGKSVDTPTVAKELGVRFILEGSVRRGGSRVRVNALRKAGLPE